MSTGAERTTQNRDREVRVFGEPQEDAKETLTRVVIDRPEGQLAAAIGDGGEWVIMVRRSKYEDWRVVCKGNLAADNSDLPLAAGEPIVVGRLRIEADMRRVLVDGEEVELTAKVVRPPPDAGQGTASGLSQRGSAGGSLGIPADDCNPHAHQPHQPSAVQTVRCRGGRIHRQLLGSRL